MSTPSFITRRPRQGDRNLWCQPGTAAGRPRTWLCLAIMLLVSITGSVQAAVSSSFENPPTGWGEGLIYANQPAGTSFPLSGVIYTDAADGTVTKVELLVDNVLAGTVSATLDASNSTATRKRWNWSRAWSVVNGRHVFSLKTYTSTGIVAVTSSGWSQPIATFEASNRPPVGFFIHQTVLPGVATTIKLNYRDDNFRQTISVRMVRGPDHGTVVATNQTAPSGFYHLNGFTYTPAAGFTGFDSFTCKFNDGFNDSPETTVRLQVRRPDQRLGTTVLVVVNQALYNAIPAPINRLKADLDQEGYVGKIIPWAATGTSVDAVWNRLQAEYLDPGQYLEGAILIGDIPKPKTTANIGGELDPITAYNDLMYWCMAENRGSKPWGPKDIWVSRINADDTAWGTQDTLITRALDANHNYRTGRSRLPATAFSYTVAEFPQNSDTGNVLKQVWSDERVAIGNSTFSPRTDLGIGGGNAQVVGGEFFEANSHGSTGNYLGSYNKAACYRTLSQDRVAIAYACSSGAPGGIVNNMLFTRGGGLVISMGGSDLLWDSQKFLLSQNRYNAYSPANSSITRSRLAAGDSWGPSMLIGYPFDTQVRNMHYGDLSLRAKASGGFNQVPTVTLAASSTRITAGQSVTFTASVTDPDAAASDSPYQPFEHQAEWFLQGYNSGRATPTAVSDDRQAGWLTRTFTYNQPGTFVARVEVMDEWMARGWKEITIIVDSGPNVPPTITEGSVATLAIAEDTRGTLTLRASDANVDTLTWSVLTQGTKGTAAASGTGTSKVVTYTPRANLNGSDAFVIQVSDGRGGLATITVNVAIAPVNDAPLLAAAIADQTATVGTAFTFTVPATTFTDVDSSTLTWTCNESLVWLSFNAATRTFSGTPTAADLTASSITVSVNDGQLTASDSFVLTVAPQSNLTTVHLPAVADATINELNATTNYGLAPTLYLNNRTGVIGMHSDVVIRFDLGTVNKSLVQGATLKLWCTADEGENVTETVSLVPESDARENFGETTVTWNNAPAMGPILGTIAHDRARAKPALYTISPAALREAVRTDTDNVLTIRIRGDVRDGWVLASRQNTTYPTCVPTLSLELGGSAPVNQVPTCAITSPVTGATFTALANLTITASASDSGGSIAKVEFFNGASKLGEDTTAPYQHVWSNVAAGSHALTVKATDNAGAVTTSTAVTVVVQAPNQPPTCAITSPVPGATFTALASLTITASASDSGGSIAKVEFFNGASKLGEDTTAPYQHVWSNVAAGSYALTVKATDNAGAVTTSAVVSVTVNASGSGGSTAAVTPNGIDLISNNFTGFLHTDAAAFAGSIVPVFASASIG